MNAEKQRRKVLKQIQNEYLIYKYKKLSECRKNIYESCSEILFYECLHEYFLYHQGISKRFLELVQDIDDILANLYRLYLKYEELSIITWAGIEELLEMYISDNA